MRVWTTVDQTVVTPGSSPSVSNVDLLSQMELAGASKVGLTVRRTLIDLVLPFTAASSYEIGLIKARLTDIGTTRINPNGDTDLDWAFEDAFYPTFSGATADNQRVVRIDSRSMRRVQEMGETWALSIWSSAFSQSVKVYARTLVLLP